MRVGRNAEGHRVDGEVASGEIALDFGEEGHRVGSSRIAARTVRAEGGHLADACRGRDPDGAEPVLVLGVREGAAELIGRGVRSEVPVDGRSARQRVAHRAADDVCGESRRLERLHESGDVDGNGGAECRLAAHAPLAAAPSPMKRKSRHAE